jgi:hypothetical protein
MTGGAKVLATAVVVSTLVAGCGGSSSSSAQLNHSQLVAKADAICTTAQKQAHTVAAPTSLADVNQAAPYFDKIAPITNTETQALAALKPDSAAASDWNAFISAQKAANSLLATIHKKADAKDLSGLQDLRKIVPAGNAVIAAATKFGAGVCAE